MKKEEVKEAETEQSLYENAVINASSKFEANDKETALLLATNYRYFVRRAIVTIGGLIALAAAFVLCVVLLGILHEVIPDHSCNNRLWYYDGITCSSNKVGEFIAWLYAAMPGILASVYFVVVIVQVVRLFLLHKRVTAMEDVVAYKINETLVPSAHQEIMRKKKLGLISRK